MNLPLGFLDFAIIAVVVIVFADIASLPTRQRLNLLRVERKLDDLLQHHGVVLPSNFSPEVQRLASDPNQKIAAIKLHQEQTSLSLTEAKAKVEEFSNCTITRETMKTTTKSSLLAILGSLLAFLAAAVYGSMLGFPAPDANPAEAVRLQFHANLSGWLMLTSVIAFVISCTLFAKRWRRPPAPRSGVLPLAPASSNVSLSKRKK
jgi:hypothetical protein